ncbi:RTA1 domain-containing protein [Trichoderma sp. SZMC 28012]
MNSTSTTNSTSHIPPNGIGALTFTPMLAPAAIFTTVYTILLILQLVLTVRFWRYYGYAIGMLGGLILELVGYIAKVQLSHNRADKNGYIMYIIGLTLGPTFLSSSLYLGISALQRHYEAARFSRLSPKLFATMFILGDFICLCFIGCGGSLAAIYAENPIGVDLMIAGLATQVLFTTIFCILLALVCRKIHYHLAKDNKISYIYCVATAAICLFIRSCWRVAELNGGFNGPLSDKEGIFIALDSIPMIIMSVLLTVTHPEFWFDKRSHLRVRSTSGISLDSKV